MQLLVISLCPSCLCTVLITDRLVLQQFLIKQCCFTPKVIKYPCVVTSNLWLPYCVDFLLRGCTQTLGRFCHPSLRLSK